MGRWPKILTSDEFSQRYGPHYDTTRQATWVDFTSDLYLIFEQKEERGSSLHRLQLSEKQALYLIEAVAMKLRHNQSSNTGEANDT